METLLSELMRSNKAELLFHILDNTPVAMLTIKAPDGKIAYANNRAKELFHIQSQQEADIIERTAKFNVLLPSGEPCPIEQLPLIRVLSNGEKIYDEELTFEFPDKRTIVTKVNAAPLLNEKKQIVAAIGIFKDITEHRNLNRLLRETIDLYSNLILASPIGIVLQSDLIIKFINPEGQKMFGVTHENEMIGRPILDFVHPDFHESTRQRMEQAKIEQAPPVERILLRLDGTPFYARVTSKQLTYKGTPAIQIIVQDIDKEKRSEHRYTNLFNDITEGLIIYDIVYDDKGEVVNFRFVDVNPAFEHLMQMKKTTVIGKLMTEIITKDELYLLDKFKKIISNCKALHFEAFSPTTEKYFDLYAYCMPPKQLGVLFMDITERKKIDEVLKRDKETLEKLVIERSHELIEAHTELERAKRLSDIGALASTVAHELRNPLVGVNISAGIIRKKIADPAVKKPLDNIEKSLAESEHIINNLLLYSKVSPPTLKRVNLYSIIEECLDNSQNQTRKYIVKKKLEPLKNIYIKADHNQIKEVFHNIINNSYEALDNKKGQIEIWSLEDKEQVKIFFKDNGPGIAKEDIDKVLNPFFTTKIKGTGLGLAVCYQIIHSHKGSIDIESTPKKGTTVTITLPK